MAGGQFTSSSTLPTFSLVFFTSFPFLIPSPYPPSSSLCTSSYLLPPSHTTTYTSSLSLFFLLHFTSIPSTSSSYSMLPSSPSLLGLSSSHICFFPDGYLPMLPPPTDGWNIFATLPTLTQIKDDLKESNSF